MRSLLETAELLKPPLHVTPVTPVARVVARADVAGFQGWSGVPVGAAGPLYPTDLQTGSAFILDFGSLIVGQLAFSLALTQAFQHIGILSLEFHVDKLSRPLL